VHPILFPDSNTVACEINIYINKSKSLQVPKVKFSGYYKYINKSKSLQVPKVKFSGYYKYINKSKSLRVPKVKFSGLL
jgi:hypothetical protein